MSKARKKNRKKGHSLAGHTFGPIGGGSFPKINEFANRNYAPLRFAFEWCQRDDKALEALAADLIGRYLLPELLNSWCEHKLLLKAYIGLLDAALVRSFVVMERLGYTPDNPLPDGPDDPDPPEEAPMPEPLDLAA